MLPVVYGFGELPESLVGKRERHASNPGEVDGDLVRLAGGRDIASRTAPPTVRRWVMVGPWGQVTGARR